MFELDKSSAFAEISRNDLLQEIETFLNNITLSNITLHKQFGDIPGDYVKTNAGYPKDDAISGTFFKTAFQNNSRSIEE